MSRYIIIFSLLFCQSIYAQDFGCMDEMACNYDSSATQSNLIFNTPLITGSSMVVGIVTTLENNLMINDEIGAFYTNENGDLICAGSLIFSGENNVLTIYGDDPLTFYQDGFLANESIYFFIKREIENNSYVVFETSVILIDGEDFTVGQQNQISNNYVTESQAVALVFNVSNFQFGCDYVEQNDDCNSIDYTCGSIDFIDNNNFLEVNDLHFEEATGVTISFWMYDDNWSLSENNQNSFGYFFDFGSSFNTRYVVRWRDDVKGIQAFFEKNIDSNGSPDEFLPDGITQNPDFNPNYGNCISNPCYTSEQTSATYIIPPADYSNNPNVYNWWDSAECDWKNITAVFCANAVRLYVDGNIVQQSMTNNYTPGPIFSLDETDVKVIGSDQFGTQFCDVRIDEFRVWSRALSSTEVIERIGDNIDINLNILAEQNNTIGQLEGYWKFDDLSLANQITGELAINNDPENIFSTQQYCNYSCNNYEYSVLCSDNSNNDCDACTPAEGCMDENADNYDSNADIDNGLCFYYGCMDDGLHDFSYIPGLAACNYDPIANVNFISLDDFQNPCQYPIVGYDCDDNCLYDCDNDGICDWLPHCFDLSGNLILTDLVNNTTLLDSPDGLPDCLLFTDPVQVDNCVPMIDVDLVNNITLELGPDNIPDCIDNINYEDYYNPLQTDSDGDGIGNSCDDNDGTTQVGCIDQTACNFDFWADFSCEDNNGDGLADCCEYCYLNDCENYPTEYFFESIGYIPGPYDCLGYCADLNNDGDYDDLDGDDVCDMIDNCPDFWNPNQFDTDEDGIGDACEEVFSLDNSIQIQYEIYPNPFSTNTTIRFNNPNFHLIQLEVFSLSGKSVFKDSFNSDVVHISSSSFSIGLYIIEINYQNLIARDILIVE